MIVCVVLPFSDIHLLIHMTAKGLQLTTSYYEHNELRLPRMKLSLASMHPLAGHSTSSVYLCLLQLVSVFADGVVECV